jgi:hypothetical protein
MSTAQEAIPNRKSSRLSGKDAFQGRLANIYRKRAEDIHQKGIEEKYRKNFENMKRALQDIEMRKRKAGQRVQRETVYTVVNAECCGCHENAKFVLKDCGNCGHRQCDRCVVFSTRKTPVGEL